MATDDRIEIPEWARSMGIMGGLVMIALGLLIAWRKSDMDVALPPTGNPTPPRPGGPGLLDIIAALRGESKT